MKKILGLCFGIIFLSFFPSWTMDGDGQKTSSELNLPILKKMVRLDTEGKKKLVCWPFTENLLSSIQSQDGRWVASWDENKLVSIYDVVKPQKIVDICHSFPIRNMALSSNGQFLMTIYDTKPTTGSVYDALNKKGIEAFEDESCIESASISDDGRYCVLHVRASQYKAEVWDMQGNRQALFRPQGKFQFSVFNPNNKNVLLVFSSSVIVWDLSSARMIIDKKASSISCASYDSQGKYIAIGCDKNKVEVYDLIQEALIVVVNCTDAVKAFDFSFDGTILAFVTTPLKGNDGVAVWDLKQGREIFYEEDYSIEKVALSPSGRYLAYSPSDALEECLTCLRIIDLKKGKIIARKRHGHHIYALRFIDEERCIVPSKQAVYSYHIPPRSLAKKNLDPKKKAYLAELMECIHQNKPPIEKSRTCSLSSEEKRYVDILIKIANMASKVS